MTGTAAVGTNGSIYMSTDYGYNWSPKIKRDNSNPQRCNFFRC